MDGVTGSRKRHAEEGVQAHDFNDDDAEAKAPRRNAFGEKSGRTGKHDRGSVALLRLRTEREEAQLQYSMYMHMYMHMYSCR